MPGLAGWLTVVWLLGDFSQADFVALSFSKFEMAVTTPGADLTNLKFDS
jgi:hypothetical protein